MRNSIQSTATGLLCPAFTFLLLAFGGLVLAQAQTANYVVTTVAGVVTITDSSGNGDTLTLSEPSVGSLLFTSTGRTFSLNGAAISTNNSGNISLGGVTSIVVDAAAGSDVIAVGAFAGVMPSLSMSGGGGDDTVNLSGDITFVANANLDLDLANDIVNPGFDVINILPSANLVTTGTGSITVRVTGFFDMVAGSSLETVNGGILVDANQLVSPTSGSFSGINVRGGTIKTSGTGALVLRGKSGLNASAFVNGCIVSNGGSIQSTSSAAGAGTINLTGQCADGSTAGAYGISIVDTGSVITSAAGNIHVTADGGVGTGLATLINSAGLTMGTGGRITGTGTAAITINASSRNAVAGSSYGMNMRDPFTAITAVNGNILITATSGNAPAASSGAVAVGLNLVTSSLIATTGTGNITVTGSAGSASSATATQGLRMDAPAQITSTTGDISLTGNGGSSPGFANHGASIRGNVTATSTGNITINGTAGTPNAVAASGSQGVQVRGGAIVSSAGGNVTLNGSSANTSGNEGVTIAIAGTGTVSIADSARSITAVSDSIFIDATSGSLNAGGGSVTLRQKTAGKLINLGVADSATTLGLTDGELDVIIAGNLTIGNSSSGLITVSAVVSPLAYKTLALGTTTFAATGGFMADVTSASVFEKMIVTGNVGITAGATLAMASSGGYVWNGTDIFLILANDGADATNGTFTGPALTNFLSSTLTGQQSYTGGSGNDLTVGASNVRPTFSGYAFSTKRNTPANVAVAKILARAADGDGGTLAVTEVSSISTQGGSVFLSGGQLLYTPATGYTGPDSFTVTIIDGQGGSVTSNIIVNVITVSGGSLNFAKITVLPGGDVALLFMGIPGQPYNIQRSIDTVNWATVSSVTAAPDGTLPYIDTNPPQGGSAFYRTTVNP